MMYRHSWLGMTGTFCALLWYHGGGMNTDMSQHRKMILEREFLGPGIEPRTFQLQAWCSMTGLFLPLCAYV